MIADYKSDQVNSNLDKLVAYYAPQVKMYREFWEKITGEKVKEAGIYFTGADQWVVV